jgi:streptogramin lyase/nicotinamidase-related amidase
MTMVVGIMAALTGLGVVVAQAESVIDEWAAVKAPPPPELKPVTVNAASTALIVMDITTQSCTTDRRPRCVAMLPHVQKLLTEARAKGVFVLYTLAGSSKRADIVKDVAPADAEQALSGAGPDKFVGIDLEAILKAKNIRTLITVGTAAEGAVLHTAASAAFRGFDVVVPVDGMSSSTVYPEQYTAWHLVNAPRLADRVSLTKVDMIKWLVAAAAQAAPPATTPSALSGQVTSAKEGPMEGVVISAKQTGSTITISVLSDDKGHYRFPASKIGPGEYKVQIRAIGYDLDGPATVVVRPDKAATLDLNLHAVDDISEQMTPAEWIASVPGTEDEKRFLYNCATCHSLQRIVKSNHTAEDFSKNVLERMRGYANSAWDLQPQMRVKARGLERSYGADADKLAAYLASINMSATGKLQYELKRLPRPTGRATQVIYTEYDVPRKMTQPHDVVLDAAGTVWFTEFGEQNLGRMDPKTGEVKEYKVPTLRPKEPTGALDLETDEHGHFWISLQNQGGIAEFDEVTGKFKVYAVPAQYLTDETQQSMVGPQHFEVDGKVWLNDTSIPGLLRVDLKTGKWDKWAPYKQSGGGDELAIFQPHSVYGIYADKRNNIFFCDFGGENIGKIETATGKVTLFPTPTRRSRPRRGRMDEQDRLWFAEWRGDKLAMFDTKTDKIQEWPVPTPYMAPYDVVLDKNGELWSGGMNTDRVLRTNFASSEYIEYLLPRSTNIRRVFVDNTTALPTFWVGNNRGASIVKLEPLD